MSSHRARKPCRRTLLLVAFAAWSLSGSPAPAEDRPDALESFGEQVDVDVVNVEAWVSDRKGQPVTGLTADDFELLVDGKPVAIRYFATVSEEGGAGDEAMLAVPETPRVSEEDRLRVVVFVDDWNLRPEDRARVLDDLKSFLDRELRPGEQVMVVVHTGSSIVIAQELTSDRDELAGSLDRLERRASPGIALASERRQALQEIERAFKSVEEASNAAALLNLDPCIDGWPDMENAYRSYAAGVTGHARASASALASAVQPLAGLPGTKVLIYVGNGLPDQPAIDVVEYLRHLCPQRQTEINNFLWSYDLNGLYDQVVAQANANRVTLYMMEAEKPGSSIDPGTTEARFRLPAQAEALRDASLESGLARLADGTGGRAVLDAADFAPALAGVGRDLRHFYSLGFVPPAGEELRDHRLEVRLKEGRGYRVRHRSAYRDKPLELRMMERVYAVAGLAAPSNPLRARIEAGEGSAGAGGRTDLPIRIWTPLDAITLVPTDEGSEGRLRVMMAVAGETDSSPIRQKTVPVKVGSAGGEEAAGHPREKLIEVSLSLPPGRHRVAIGLRDELGGETSYLRYDLDLPPTNALSRNDD